MAKMIKVGWVPTIDMAEALCYNIEPLFKHFKFPAKSALGFCPAIREAYNKFFIVRAIVDIEISIDPIGGIRGMPKTVTNMQKYSTMFSLIDKEAWREPAMPIVQHPLYMSIATDTPDVKMTILPPFLHKMHDSEKICFIPGSMNIYNWPFRTINTVYEWRQPNEVLKIKRGEPIAYLLFEHTNIDSRFTVFEAEKTPTVERMMFVTGGKSNDTNWGPSTWLRNTSEILRNFGKRRPKKVVIPKK